MTETWTNVEGYIGQYRVSNTGKVKSLPRLSLFTTKNQYNNELKVVRRVSGRLHTKFNKRKGYPYITLFCEGVPKKHSVHRLVAEHFVDNPNNLPEVNHKDGDKENNHHSNLEWVSSSENQIHSIKVLGFGRGERHGRAKLTDVEVLAIRSLYNEGMTVNELLNRYSISKSTVRRVVNRQCWTHI